MAELVRAGRPAAAALVALLLIAGAAFAGNAMLSPQSPSSDGQRSGAGALVPAELSQLSGPDESAEPTETAEPTESVEPAESAEPAETAEPAEDANQGAESGDSASSDQSAESDSSGSVDQGSHDGSNDGPSASQSTDDGSGHD